MHERLETEVMGTVATIHGAVSGHPNLLIEVLHRRAFEHAENPALYETPCVPSLMTRG
jgi:hypothetical protein